MIAKPDGADLSCNVIFARLGHIPIDQKDIVLTVTDRHGDPALSSGHGVCAGSRGTANVDDWNFCWKVWDALRTAALHGGTSRQFALENTPQHRSNGTWSDGTPIESPDPRPRPRDASFGVAIGAGFPEGALLLVVTVWGRSR